MEKKISSKIVLPVSYLNLSQFLPTNHELKENKPYNYSILLSWTDEIPYRYINFMFHALNFIIWKKNRTLFPWSDWCDYFFFNQRDFVSAKYLILPVHSTDEIKLSSFKLYNFRKKKNHTLFPWRSLSLSLYLFF